MLIQLECGFTSQFEGLQSLYEKYKDQGVCNSRFPPCNQFGGQEPGSGEEAAQNCRIKLWCYLPYASKIDVKGEHQLPSFRYLTAAQHGFFNEKIKWNFTKFLVDHLKVTLLKRFAPQKTCSNRKRNRKIIIKYTSS